MTDYSWRSRWTAAALVCAAAGLASTPLALGAPGPLLERHGGRPGTDRAVTLVENLEITYRNLEGLLDAVVPLYIPEHPLAKEEAAAARGNFAALFDESLACDRLILEASMALKRGDLPRLPFSGELQMPTARINAAEMKDDLSADDLRVAVAFSQDNVIRAQAYLLRMKMAGREGSPLAVQTASDLAQRRAWLSESRARLRAARDRRLNRRS